MKRIRSINVDLTTWGPQCVEVYDPVSGGLGRAIIRLRLDGPQMELTYWHELGHVVLGHTQDAIDRIEVTKGHATLGILRQEAAAWRFALYVLRASGGALTLAARAHIRKHFGSYVLGFRRFVEAR